MSKKICYLQCSHKSMFWSARKFFGKYSNNYIINNQWFRVTCIMLCSLQKRSSLQFSNKKMLESAQHTKNINSNHYVINHMWFRVAYIILCNLRSRNSQILPSKAPPGNLVTEKRKKRFKTFLQAGTWNLRCIFLNCKLTILR